MPCPRGELDKVVLVRHWLGDMHGDGASPANEEERIDARQRKSVDGWGAFLRLLCGLQIAKS